MRQIVRRCQTLLNLFSKACNYISPDKSLNNTRNLFISTTRQSLTHHQLLLVSYIGSLFSKTVVKINSYASMTGYEEWLFFWIISMMKNIDTSSISWRTAIEGPRDPLRHVGDTNYYGGCYSCKKTILLVDRCVHIYTVAIYGVILFIVTRIII